MKIRHIIISTIITLLAVCSCDDSGCTLNNVALTHYGFYADTDGKLAKIKLLDTLTVRAFGTDSVLVNLQDKASTLDLPMSYFAEADTLVFEYINQGIRGRDTIKITKSNQPHYESPDCPTAMFHIITGIEHTCYAIDTVIIASPTVNYLQDENICVVFRSAD